MAETTAILKINGKTYDKGWDEIVVHTSMDGLSVSFDFSTTQRSPFNPSKWEIQMGAPCTIEYAGNLMATGYIEDIDINYEKNSHTVKISGRDKLADIVDSTTDGKYVNWVGVSAQAIIQQLLDPFKVKLKVHSTATSQMSQILEPKSINTGDPVFDLIMKIIKLTGMVGIAQADGSLQISAQGILRAGDKLIRGQNVLTGSLKQSDRERFSVYFVKGYDFTAGGQNTTKQSYFDRFEDTGVRRFRAIGLTVEALGDFRNGESRAMWEAKMRAGKSRKYGYTVQGWTQKTTGKLWDINMLVNVKDDFFAIPSKNIPGDLLINSIEFSQSTSSGSLTRMQLVSPEKWKAQVKLDKIKSLNDGLAFQNKDLNKVGK